MASRLVQYGCEMAWLGKCQLATLEGRQPKWPKMMHRLFKREINPFVSRVVDDSRGRLDRRLRTNLGAGNHGFYSDEGILVGNAACEQFQGIVQPIMPVKIRFIGR